eukprot:TRINITY_DN615_c0_g1_i2.p1 TRINITY_DN615_c0_g1~~TRINITY_DN615_c0_g1_i2.p1  ORF type:complete len:182 (+),score=37.08 TRINITY_DN615_c0_g1_i2:233-778(+)
MSSGRRDRSRSGGRRDRSRSGDRRRYSRRDRSRSGGRRDRSRSGDRRRGRRDRSRSGGRRDRSRSGDRRRGRRRDSSRERSYKRPRDSSSDSYEGRPTTKKPRIEDLKDIDINTADASDVFAMMGLPTGFNSTKGKKVKGNDTLNLHIKTKIESRQYMNRPGGFNRILDPATQYKRTKHQY